jgi:hypothetical protein
MLPRPHILARAAVFVVVALAVTAAGVAIRLIPRDLPYVESYAAEKAERALHDDVARERLADSGDLPAPTALEQQIASEARVRITTAPEQHRARRADLERAFADGVTGRDGALYTLENDPYYYLRHARQIDAHGVPGDRERAGVAWDDHTGAPAGRPVDPTSLAAVLAALHQVLGDGAELATHASWLPIILSALSILVAFLLGARIGGLPAAIVTSTTIALHEAIVSRTLFGSPDTDGANVLMPLVVICLWAFADGARPRRAVPLMAAAGVVIGLYSTCWTGWWFFFDLTVAASVAVAGRWGWRRWREGPGVPRGPLVAAATYLATAFVSIGVIHGPLHGVRALVEPLRFDVLDTGSGVFPSIYATVAELQPLGIVDVISASGGVIVFFGSLVGLVGLLRCRDRDASATAVLALLWFVATVYACTKGSRFAMLLMMPMAIGLGAGVARIGDALQALVSTPRGRALAVSFPVAVVIVLLGVRPIPPFCGGSVCGTGLKAARDAAPLYNDAWDDVARRLRAEAPADAILTTWWDMGHILAAQADRRVTIDGGSQNGPEAAWVARLFLESDERRALGLLRMLDCGGARLAQDTLATALGDPFRAAQLLSEVVALDVAAAPARLAAEGVGPRATETILAATFCAAPSAFLITSDEMADTTVAWGKIGAWSFPRAALWADLARAGAGATADRLAVAEGISRDDAIADVTGAMRASGDRRTAFATEDLEILGEGPCTEVVGMTRCLVDGRAGLTVVSVDLAARFAELVQTDGKVATPALVLAVDDGRLVELDLPAPADALAVVLTARPDGRRAVLMPRRLARSVFTRLHYLEGASLDRLQLVDSVDSPVGTRSYNRRRTSATRVRVYRVDWTLPELRNQESASDVLAP